MRLAARFMSALLIATLLLPSLLAVPAAAFTTTDPDWSLVDAASPISVDVGSVTVIVVLKETGGADVGHSDGTVTLTVGGDASLTGVVDNGDGTYTSTLSDTTAESVTVHGKIDGTDITNEANVTFTPGALDHIVVSPSSASKVANAGQAFTAAGFDQFDNPAGDETGSTTFTIGGSGASCAINVCKATIAGAHTVTGDDGGLQDTATLNVTAVCRGPPRCGWLHRSDRLRRLPHPDGDRPRRIQQRRDRVHGHRADHEHRRSREPAVQPHLHRWRRRHPRLLGHPEHRGHLHDHGDRYGRRILTDDQTGIDVTPGAANHLTVSGFGDPIAAGTAGTFTVTARDATGNVDPSYTGTVHFTSSDAQGTFDADYTFTGGDAGHHLFNGTLRTAGAQSITATDTVTASINGTQSAISVTPAAATTLSLSAYPGSTVAGASHNVTVTALDAFGNTDTDYAGTVTVTATGGTTHVSPSGATALTSGVGTFGITFDTVGLGPLDRRHRHRWGERRQPGRHRRHGGDSRPPVPDHPVPGVDRRRRRA